MTELEIEKKQKIKKKDNFFYSIESLGKNVVIDPDAPLLYSQIAIIAFSIFLNPFLGAVLLAMNIGNKSNKIKVIGVGVLFLLALVCFFLIPDYYFSSFVRNVYYFVIFVGGFVGGYLFSIVFWNKYIGRETKYRAKPIWIPLIIFILLLLCLIVAILLLYVSIHGLR